MHRFQSFPKSYSQIPGRCGGISTIAANNVLTAQKLNISSVYGKGLKSGIREGMRSESLHSKRAANLRQLPITPLIANSLAFRCHYC